MTMKTMAMLAALLAAPALAQTTPTPATPLPPATLFAVVPIPPTDPVRLAAARPVIDRLFPKGSYARMMRTVFGPVMHDSMARSFAMKPGDLIPGLDAAIGKAGANPADNQTLGQMAAKNDPYFQQRMSLTLDAVGDEMAKVMTELEPDMRDALAHAYARRFTVAQLGEMDRFFATPTGQAYAADSLTLMMSPDMTVATQGFLPRLVKEAPEMMARITAATKDLPPPGKAKLVAPKVEPVPPAKKTP